MDRQSDPIENLLKGCEELYQMYRGEGDWGEIAGKIEEMNKAVVRIRQAQVRAKAKERANG